MSVMEIVTLVLVAMYFALSIILRLAPRIAIIAGLALFTVSAIWYAITLGGWSDEIAIFAFYFLAAGVFLLLIELAREGYGKSKEKDQD